MDHAIQLASQLSEHLKSLRNTKGLTQAELGKRLGLGQVRIAEIEKNPAAIGVDQLIKLLAALDTQVILRPKRHIKPGPAARVDKSGSRGVW